LLWQCVEVVTIAATFRVAGTAFAIARCPASQQLETGKMKKFAIVATCVALALVSPAMARGGGGHGGGHGGGGFHGGGASFHGGGFHGGGRFAGGGGYPGGRFGGAGLVGAGIGLAAGAALGSYHGGYGGYYDDYADNGYDGSGYADQAYAAMPDDNGLSCAQRYRSYDARSGTYLAYDGNRYACQ
jgi:hypothetical protein